MKKAAKVLLVIVIIIGALFLIFNGKRLIQNISVAHREAYVISQETTREFVRDVWGDEPSDIEGMTKYDKYVAGLSMADGSDTDGDGVSDKDEIEKYGTNPLDNPNKPAPSLTDATDFFKSMSSTKDYHIYKAYLIDNNRDDVTIDVSDILSDEVKISDLRLLVTAGIDYTFFTEVKPETDKKAGKITYENTDIYDSYGLVIVDKRKEGNLLSRITNTMRKGDMYTEIPKGDAVLVDYLGWPMAFWKHANVHIYYVSSGDEHEDRIMLQNMIDWENDLAPSQITVETCEELTKEEMVAKRLVFEKSPFFDNCVDEPDGVWPAIWHYLHPYYYDYDQLNEYCGRRFEISREIREWTMNSFGSDDVLPFCNFRSEISTGGNCAGIDHLTLMLFNTGKNEEGKFPECSVTGLPDIWDRHGFYDGKTLVCEDNDFEKYAPTLFDTGLSDFQDKNYIKNNRKTITFGKDDKGNPVEIKIFCPTDATGINFYIMIGDYWVKANRAIAYDQNAYDLNSNTIDTIIQRLNDGKISSVSVGLYDCAEMSNYMTSHPDWDFDSWEKPDEEPKSSGHDIIIYNYTNMNQYYEIMGESIPGSEGDINYRFDIYDCNYPELMGELYMDVRVHPNGTFDFKYENSKIEYRANSGFRDDHFSPLDENYNLLD